MDEMNNGKILMAAPAMEKCNYCQKESYGLMQNSETYEKFHFDCYIRNIVKEEVEIRLEKLKKEEKEETNV